MNHESRKNDFLDKLYAAAVGAEAWKNVLESYTRLVGGHASLLSYYDIPAGTARTIEWHNFSDSYIAASNSYWKARNPWGAAGLKSLRDPEVLRTGGFVSAGSELVSQRDLLATEWYNDFASESLVQDCLTTVGISGGMRGVALIANTGGHPPATYASAQVSVAEGVLTDVQRAIALHISSAGQEQHLLAVPGYMQMKLPVIAVHGRRILTSNTAAMVELEAGRLIRRANGKLVVHDPQLDRMLAHLADVGGAQQMSLIATGLDGSRFLAQAVRFNRLRGTLMATAGADDPAVMLVLTALDAGGAGREAALTVLNCFTPVEQAIAACLVNGQSIEDIARERRASVQTIRWHIRNMSTKTGEHGVRGLTRMLTLLLPY